MKRELASATDLTTRTLVGIIFGSISNKCYIQQLFSYLCYFYEANSEADLLELCIAASGIELEETGVGYFFQRNSGQLRKLFNHLSVFNIFNKNILLLKRVNNPTIQKYIADQFQSFILTYLDTLLNDYRKLILEINKREDL